MNKMLFLVTTIVMFSLCAQENRTIEIGTFNIRFFPCNQDSAMMTKYGIEMRYPPTGVPTDTTALFKLIEELDIEVLGVEELVDPALFGEMAKRHLGENFELVYAPSNAWQKVGILYNSSAVKLIGDPQIYEEVALGRIDRHRPALRAYFKAIPNGFDFHVIVVHLKASPRGYEERVKQWGFLENILTGLPEGPEKDADIILLGDFNNVSKNKYKEFLPVMNKLNYFWPVVENDTFVTSYWQPDWKKQRLQASTIDQIFISDNAKVEYVGGSIKAGGICGDGKKEILNDFPNYYKIISDHCPVYSSFKIFPDDD